MTSSRRAPAVSLPALLQVLSTTATGEVQFNCPWCTTRLALPAADFQNERAVLCPRCNNPIDLTVQRRIAQQPAPPPPPAAAPGRRMVTTPKPEPPRRRGQAPSKQAPPQPSLDRTLPPLQKKKRENASLDFDPDKPIDIDGAFKGEPIQVDDIDSLMSTSDLWSWNAPRTAGAEGKEVLPDVVCPSCKYENTPIPEGFEFGKVRKCTWCGKPLPES